LFKAYQFKNFIYQALDELKFIKPTEIQKRIIPKVMAGENVIGKSQTGTGKTHAFLLPLIDKLSNNSELEVLILTPTRELGFQLYEETVKITKHAPTAIDVRLYVGGADRVREMERLERSQPKIAIGTVGKITDLAVSSNILKIHTAKTVVFDEADMIFEFDKLEKVDQIITRLDKAVQILVFSATVNYSLRDFLNKYLAKLPMIDLSEEEFTKSSINHIFIPTKNKSKEELLAALLATFHPFLALIFVNTKSKVDELSAYLAASGYPVAKLSGDLQARARKQVLRRIKNGDYQYVVATDLAARGIDIIGVSHVINYELPDDIDYFVHRVGRTGRADFTGTSISLYDYEDDFYLNKLKAKGLNCVYMTLKQGELIKLTDRDIRPSRPALSMAEELHRAIPLPKKIKPGYRKKRKMEIEKQIRRQRRQKIEAIYRRKGKQR